MFDGGFISSILFITHDTLSVNYALKPKAASLFLLFVYFLILKGLTGLRGSLDFSAQAGIVFFFKKSSVCSLWASEVELSFS